ncbi:hypothetical protein AKG11_28220 [Shinella sp. SUS2]|uniref:sigma factor-like helix-turn-helix DNA-binding protein n=1 Tax=unclassified Shinella TaxID=2643062 RepID=UPI0006829C87|nr:MULTISPECIES: sigma factor-like helix-turn-helix DNA-binding protein [unclassified Shinella]KNY13622.1 hypothetical protein AKG11_28220 [Shinella sp. SUS2]KOC72515.1 hypothetical protein AKG10_27085 [Shinella sp. GWS1]
MGDLTNELLAKLGEDDFLLLVERAGGARLYVPGDLTRSDLPSLVGVEMADRLSKLYRNNYIRVPLARDIRISRYRKAGMSNREIARTLGISESGVDKAIQRGKRRRPADFPKKKDERQMDMLDLLDNSQDEID